MRVGAAFFALLCTIAPAFAQESRRDREEPELVVEPGGRTGTCDVLSFSPDGKLLFAAGDDKVVRVWPNGPEGLDASRMQTLRWPSWREQRGGIKALGIAPDGNRIVVGGFGLRSSTVAIINRLTGQIEEISYPESIKAGQNFYAVMCAEFSPDGKSVVFGTADGSIWNWQVGQKPALVGKQTGRDSQDKPVAFNRIRLVAFLNDKQVVSVAQDGQVNLWPLGSVDGSKSLDVVPITRDGRSPIFRAALSSDRRWLVVGGNAPTLTVCNLETSKKKTYQFPDNQFIRAVAFERGGRRLAAAVGALKPGAKFAIEADDRIFLFDDPTGSKPLSPTGGPPNSYRADALAFDDLGRLAVACAQDAQVYLWDPRAPVKPISDVHGAGRNLWNVRISAAGTSISFRDQRDGASIDPNRRGMGAWHAFDLTRCKPIDSDLQWIEPLTTSDGWTVEADAESRFLWWAVNTQKGLKLPLRLNPDRDEAPRCFTFLNKTADHPTQVLLGHFYGCSLFDLNEKEAVRRQVFVGHAGEVMSVAPSKDQKWFVTCGTDQTVAGWSAEDWRYQAQLGASFEVENNKLVVKKIDIGSPAWELGLVPGDEIVLLVVADHDPFFNRSGKYGGRYGKARGSPEDCLSALQSPAPGQSLYFGWKHTGDKTLHEQVTTLPRRPLWRMFPAFNDTNVMSDWVVWMWKTSCYVTSTNGDYLIGWHVNDPSLDRTPRFYRAEQFRDQFNKPLVIMPLLTNRDLASAIARARKTLKFGALEPAPVTIEPREPIIGPKGVELTLRVKQRGSNPDLLPERVELWVNDFRFPPWKPGEQNFEQQFTIPTDKLRDGSNQITLQTFNRVGGRGEAVALVPFHRESVNRGLVGLFVGVNNYANSKVKNPDGSRAFGDLKSAVNDALRLHDRWLEQTGKDRLFGGKLIRKYLDADAKRKEILAQLDAAAIDARPDDLFILFLAGHGDFVRPPAAKGAEPAEGTFVFCCPEYDRKKPDETGISTAVLFDKLSRISARKLVLLDACHSGQAASTNLVRDMTPTGKGLTVISACDQQEQAFENPKFKDGLFTYAVLEALGPRFNDADVNPKDGRLDADELFQYVKGRLPSLLKDVDKDPYDQNPICFPREPEKFPVGKK